MDKQSIYSQTYTELDHFVRSSGHKSESTNFIFRSLYKPRNDELRSFKNVSSKLIDDLYDLYSFDLPRVTSTQVASDKTTKFLMKFRDDKEVETVLLPFRKLNTLCLSTQVGCAMNCSFCYTATQGYVRHLKTEEIVGQYLAGWRYQKDHWKSHHKAQIVFMGQGEPLHNLNNLKKAMEIFVDPKAIQLSPKQMTLSTVGYLPGLERFEELPPVNLALSLHSPFDEQRNELIPLNQRYPLADVLRRIDEIIKPNDECIVFEYLVIKNFNDTMEHAKALGEIVLNRKSLVNLIPFNPFPGSSYIRPSDADVSEFKDKLVSYNVRTMIRTTKGDDILAACGQLKTQKRS